jgi:serine protease AprX
VTVALIDTGVSPDADGLSHVEHINVSGAPDGDGLGHGTFLAGIIGGRGNYQGVAPGADMVDVQVADGEGNTSLSKVLAGLDAVNDRGDVDVVNISLSTSSPLPPVFDPLNRALERLWATGVTVVAAAGNDGPEGEVSSPGNSPTLLTVGALDEAGTAERADDSIAAFSSGSSGSGTSKPELVAPGVSLVSTLSPGSIAADKASWTDDGYMPGSGTSMSAAVVSGAAAAVLGANNRLKPNGVKALLTGTAYAGDEFTNALDLSAALAAAPTAKTNPKLRIPAVDPGEWGPAEEDEEAWADFAAAWRAGDLEAVKAAWERLSWQTQQWAARSWSFAVLVASLGLSEEDFKARSWSARSWSLDEWLARSWSARSWSARSWSYEEWLARSWSARSWSARSWSARSWSVDEWLARSWSARSWSDLDWAARSWSARSWSARSWSARSWSARSWSDFAWEARSWSARSWSARSWSMTA